MFMTAAFLKSLKVIVLGDFSQNQLVKTDLEKVKHYNS